jgi:hypothetical protein
VVLISALFIAGAIGFAVINFYLTRYLLYIIPMVCIAGAWVISVATHRLAKRVRFVAFGIIGVAAIVLGETNMDRRGFQDTSDMGYVHVVRNKQEALIWAQAQPWRDSVVSANFPIFQALQDPRFGYVSRPWPYSENDNPPSKYAIIWNGDEPSSPTWLKSRPHDTIKQFDDEYSHIVIVRFK